MKTMSMVCALAALTCLPAANAYAASCEGGLRALDEGRAIPLLA